MATSPASTYRIMTDSTWRVYPVKAFPAVLVTASILHTVHEFIIKLLWILYSNFYDNSPQMPQACTCHEGLAVVRCAKLWPDWITIHIYKENCAILINMMTSNDVKWNIFRVTGLFCREFTGHRWIPRTKASDAELWCFLWSVSE